MSDAIKILGKHPSEELLKDEEKEEEISKKSTSGWSIIDTNGNIATVTNGVLRGYVPIDNQNPSFFCGNCGAFGPWSGARCLVCGSVSESALD